MDLLARWEKFVAECERGYSSDAEDYFNDLTSRDAIERALRDEGLSQHPEMAVFRQQVIRIDLRFQALLRPNAFPRFSEEDWWARGIVRRAGHRLVNDLRDGYGMVVDPVTEPESTV